MNKLPVTYGVDIDVIPQNVTASNTNYDRASHPHTPAPARHYTANQQVVAAAPSNDLSHQQVVSSLRTGESVTVTTTFARSSNHVVQAHEMVPFVFGLKEVLGISFGLFFVALMIVGSLK